MPGELPLPGESQAEPGLRIMDVNGRRTTTTAGVQRMTDGEDDDCCCCACAITTCLGSQYNGSNLRLKNEENPLPGDPCYIDKSGWVIIHGPDARGTYYNKRSGPFGKSVKKECYRIAVYDCALHDGYAFNVNESKRTNLRTHNHAYGGPFEAVSRGSGVFLNTNPFWWKFCGGGGSGGGIGGWVVTNDWWVPDFTNLRDIYSLLDAELGASMPAVGQSFTLILYTKRTRMFSTCEKDSYVKLLAAHITCPSL